jgi:hypothetical protein
MICGTNGLDYVNEQRKEDADRVSRTTIRKYVTNKGIPYEKYLKEGFSFYESFRLPLVIHSLLSRNLLISFTTNSDQPIAGPLPAQDNTTQRYQGQTFMLYARLEPLIQ